MEGAIMFHIAWWYQSLKQATIALAMNVTNLRFATFQKTLLLIVQNTVVVAQSYASMEVIVHPVVTAIQTQRTLSTIAVYVRYP
jgi:hypothetical protein